MARIAEMDVDIQHDGLPTKPGEMAEPKPAPLYAMSEAEKQQFKKDCEGAISIEEFRKRALEHVNNLPWKK